MWQRIIIIPVRRNTTGKTETVSKALLDGVEVGFLCGREVIPFAFSPTKKGVKVRFADHNEFCTCDEKATKSFKYIIRRLVRSHR